MAIVLTPTVAHNFLRVAALWKHHQPWSSPDAKKPGGASSVPMTGKNAQQLGDVRRGVEIAPDASVTRRFRGNGEFGSCDFGWARPGLAGHRFNVLGMREVSHTE